jgi:hypothetical protein
MSTPLRFLTTITGGSAVLLMGSVEQARPMQAVSRDRMHNTYLP